MAVSLRLCYRSRDTARHDSQGQTQCRVRRGRSSLAFDEGIRCKAAEFIGPDDHDARSWRPLLRRTEHYVRVLVHRHRTRLLRNGKAIARERRDAVSVRTYTYAV